MAHIRALLRRSPRAANADRVAEKTRRVLRERSAVVEEARRAIRTVEGGR